MTWFNYKEVKPEVGVEVLAQSDKWIDEDYNPKGIRIGLQNESNEDGYFVCAQWNNIQDFYKTQYMDIPEKWKYTN